MGLDTRPAPTWQSVVEGAFTKYSNGLHFSVAESGPDGELETRLLSQWTAGVKQTDYLEDVSYNFFYENANKFVNLATAGIPNLVVVAVEPQVLRRQFQRVRHRDFRHHGRGVQHQSRSGRRCAHVLVEPFEPVLEGQNGNIVAHRGCLASKGEPATAGNYYMEGMLLLENAFGRSYLRQLFGQSPTFEASSITGAGMVASGADQISVLSQVDSSSSLIKEGAPLKFVPLTSPDIGTGAVSGY